MAEGTRNSQTITGLSSTAGFPFWFPDIMQNPFNVSIAVSASSSATNYNVEGAFGFTGTSAWNSSADTWFVMTGFSTVVGNNTGNVAFPVPVLRLNVTAGSSQTVFTATVLQSGA
jgi:hypothetical protein